MKKIILFALLAAFTLTTNAQQNYWQQQANFTIDVSLNDNDNSLTAFETIEYINNSPDTLHFIWFHIWPNAYKNDRTAFSEQLLKERRTDFYFSKPGEKGYINQLNFKVDGSNAVFVDDSTNIDIIKLLLPAPLAPGNKTIITTPFKVKLPYNFSRGGHVGKDYQATQWFPKPAVYDRNGWHPFPYLDQGEFYSEFGNFDVEITVPSKYIVAATGVLQDAKTLDELKEKGKQTIEGATKVWHYKQENIHDFAWFASKDFVVNYDTAILPSNKIIDVFSYHKPKANGWQQSVAYAKDGIKKYSAWLGDYPYTVATIVEGSKNENSGGMEYPTITLITTQETGQELDATIVHEVGHNWFYAALATNERLHPWMDEGMNTYYQKRYENEKYPPISHLKGTPFENKKPADEEGMLLATMARLKKDQSIETPSANFTEINYGLVAYYKAGEWMKKLEQQLGKTTFDSAMHNYYSKWKFKHPTPQDFKSSIEKTSGQDLSNTFNLLQTTGTTTSTQKTSFKPSLFFNLNNKHNYINIAPAFGYNNYDKAMVGGLVHNLTLPLPNLQFVAGVLYGTGSKKLNGFGHASYNIYNRTYHFSTDLSYLSFSQNDFLTSNNTKLILGVKRWTPSINLTLYDKDPLSTRRFTFHFKTFLLNEDALNYKTVYAPPDTLHLVSLVNNSSYINRLSFGVSDNRILFPYSINISTDQGKDFIKTGVTAKMFFNYADGKSGMNVRFFAGKFFYLHPETRNTIYLDRYFLNLSGPKGSADYTYSDYFVGRNEFEGKNNIDHWQTQQIMERDGFFKVNTDQLDYFGTTDDWLMSANISSDLPHNLNPLSILPFKIPLKIFADVGTYAQTWQDNSPSGRFLYDAGLQIPLLHSLIDIYIPLFYSKVYGDYYKSNITKNRFLKTIAFTININKLQVQQVLKDIPL